MNRNLTILAAVAMLGTSGAAYAQASATGTANGTTRILQAISIAKGSDLQFGRIVRGSANSTIEVDTEGQRTLTSGNAALANGGAVTAASFTVTGEGGQSFSIDPDDTITLTNLDGDGELAATTVASASTATLSNEIGTQGTATFSVGGTLTVPSSAASGNYSGSFNVIVAYN